MPILCGALAVRNLLHISCSDLRDLSPDCLASSHHGKGIMTAAVRTLMQEWVVPCMGAKAMRVEACEGNVGSVKVFEKNGFEVVDTVPRPITNNFGVFHSGLHILMWRAK